MVPLVYMYLSLKSLMEVARYPNQGASAQRNRLTLRFSYQARTGKRKRPLGRFINSSEADQTAPQTTKRYRVVRLL